ncbi:MAG: hypothetical protein C0593_05230 [Marinilabiliales bacterium]|nr:MAG: hypothetical protein C0593_05230 [Marinilabiliales bacterium]
MKTLELNVLPLKGLGDLYFGMPMEEMSEIMGEADEIEDIVDDDDFNTTVLNYSDAGISIFFEGVDAPVLSCLEVDNKNCKLFGKKIFEMNQAELVAHVKENGLDDLDVEEEEWGEKRISFEDGLIDFYFSGDELTSINWGVLVNEEGEVEDL